MNNIKISGFSDEISQNTVEQFEALNKLNISYFEPRGIDGKRICDLTDAEVDELKGLMAKYGIKASSIGSPIGKIRINEDFEPHFELYKRVVEIAKELDCRYIRMFSFYPESKDAEWTAENRDEVFRRLGLMLEYAKQEDVVLLHENEKGIYGDVASRCLEIMQNFACDNFRAVFDPANFIQSGQDTTEAFEMLKDYVGYMHIKDSIKGTGRVTPAGMGDGNVEFILSELLKNGYEGFLSLEPHLGSFEGLADLELDDDMLALPKSSEGTFTVAYQALMKILNNIQ